MDSHDDSQFNPEYLSGGLVIAGRYEIVQLLGAGGMGAVYLAQDRVLGDEQIAIKVLHRQFAFDQKYTQRFLREVQLMRKINHLNVVRTYDVGADNDIVYFTMELVPGRSLVDFVNQHKLSKHQLVNTILQICDGLSAIHAAGIVHRDLKPENIIILDDGTVKITDFGVARPENSQLTAHNEVIGSSAYIAPEVWLGNQISPATDLYALGVILYEITTGRQPFEAEAPAVMMRLHLDKQPTPPKQLNQDILPWLNKLILNLLEKDPKKRPKSAPDIVKHLELLNLTKERFADRGKNNIAGESEDLLSRLESRSRRSTDENSTTAVKRDTRAIEANVFPMTSKSSWPSIMLAPFRRDHTILSVRRSKSSFSILQLAWLAMPVLLIACLQLAGFAAHPAQLAFNAPDRALDWKGLVVDQLPFGLVNLVFLATPVVLLHLLGQGMWRAFYGLCSTLVVLTLILCAIGGKIVYPSISDAKLDANDILYLAVALKQNLIEIAFLSPFVTTYKTTVLSSGVMFEYPQLELVTTQPFLAGCWLAYFTFIMLQLCQAARGFTSHPLLAIGYAPLTALGVMFIATRWPNAMGTSTWTWNWLNHLWLSPSVAPWSLITWCSLYLGLVLLSRWKA